jgi:uncharacterized protein (UPF0332 family)
LSHEWEDLWRRALDALEVARREAKPGPDASASRAYYAAFYGVSALFALDGREFRRHSEVEAAVHRDLVRDGNWTKELGAAYTELLRLREVGDYGGDRHVTPEQAQEAVGQAARILRAISRQHPEQLEPPTG